MVSARSVAVRVARHVVTAAAGLLLLPSLATAQGSDTTAPQLEDFTFAPASIDVSSGPATVTVTLAVTDDRSGVGPACCPVQFNFRSPSGKQTRGGSAALSSGTPLDGTWTATISIPPFSESGTWKVDYVSLRDGAGNTAYLRTGDLEALGFPVALAVTSIEDVTSPGLSAFGFVPAIVDTSATSQSVDFTLGITDDLAGVSPACCPVQFRFRSQSGVQAQDGIAAFDTGTPLDGTWKATVSFPRFSEAGTWRVDYVALRDLAGNTASLHAEDLSARGFATEVEVVSNPSDTTPPQVAGFTVTPAIIDSSTGARTVAVGIEVTEDLAGVGPECCPVQVRFESPSGRQRQGGSAAFSSGTPLDGLWGATIVFPRFSEAGTWKVEYLSLRDLVGNLAYLRASDVEALGFPTEITVIRPSLVVDGTVTDPAAGGIVFDQTFGTRAQVTFPPDVLGDATDVAIDVFEDPLDVPSPQGYLGAGTLFVNIALTPEPAFPLGPPGLTVVLPLASFQAPGTSLALFRIEPATGMLVPALDWSGQPVIGTVDGPDGWSATFTGVARLSTVVGLVPAVSIDIKPGDARNTINLSSRGVTPVAILTTPGFDAASVDPFSVTLAGAPVRPHGRSGAAGALEDVDGDGDLDLVVQIETAELELTASDTEAVLTALTFDGVAIEARDVVTVIALPTGKEK